MQQLFHILNSGMILTDLDNNYKHYKDELGELSSHITNDGSLSLKNSNYNELFHSSSGALKEAKTKFLNPAQINRFLNIKRLRVLDICFGLGYNSACLFEELQTTPINTIWWGLEIDPRPLKKALASPIFRKIWSYSVLRILKSIDHTGEWQDPKGRGNLIWGDARKQIATIPRSLNFDLIFHDAFSPSKCPELWSEEFLHILAKKLAPNGRFITYSSSAAIRGSLKRAGLELNSLVPTNSKENRWSSGTLAIRSSQDNPIENNSTTWKPLSEMEKEHLLTSAGIPYRDPKGCSSANEIINRRRIEQENCNLQSTSSWKKRWDNT